VITCLSVTDGTEKSVSTAKILEMEDNKQNTPRVIVEVEDSGPIKILGKIHLNDMQRGTEKDSIEVLLCRCGKSGNKPFCDESHRTK
jgi:CDGSH-type Zn-finger protein